MDDGTLTLTAGNGDMTARTTVKIYTASSGDSDDDNSTDVTTTASGQSSSTSEQSSSTLDASITPESTGIAVPSVTPAASGEATDAFIKTGGAAQIFTGILNWVLIGAFALLFITCVILFLRKKKRK